MYTGLKHLHSFLPYLLLLILSVAVVVFLFKRFRGGEFTSGDRKLALFGMVLSHLQLVIGLILYAISPLVKAAYSSGELMGNDAHRFIAVEHLTTMIVAIVFITIGYSRAKRSDTDAGKFRALSLFYTLGLVFMLSRIPWEIWPAL